MRPHLHTTSFTRILLVPLLVSALILTSCASLTGLKDKTSGPEFSPPPLTLSPANLSLEESNYSIDTSTLSQGYVSAAGVSESRLKFKVTGSIDYNYDLPNDGTPITCPLNMGEGLYQFTIWENTTRNMYIQVTDAVTYDVVFDSEFEPYIRPSFFCRYNETSLAVQKANELSAGAANEGEVLKNIYNWITDNVEYDTEKAIDPPPGYVPDPDATLESGTGICFDYASLAAAMLRSQGIPCKIMTGHVSPDNIYHAWNMVYIDGTWTTVGLNVDANTWTRIDTTFAAGGNSNYVGDGVTYTDLYTY